jgi:hypothetical protein
MKNACSRTARAVLMALSMSCELCLGVEHGAVENIITALLKFPAQRNVNITARQTTIVFCSFDPVSRLLNSDSHLNKELVDKLRHLTAQDSGVVSNVQTCVYSFRDQTVLVKNAGLDPRTKLLEERILTAHDDVFSCKMFVGSRLTNYSYIGEICPRVGSVPTGVPCYLSKAILAEWLRSAPDAVCAAGTSSAGSNCYVLTVSAPVESPIRKYELFVRINDMCPIELSSCLSDGKVYAITRLEFDGDSASGFCKRASTRVFSGEHVFKESLWERIGVEKDDSALGNGKDSFFTIGTQVLDRRFIKPITYSYGTRMPNEEEVKAMLKDARGVVNYQRATHSKAELEKLRAYRLSLSGASDRRRAVARVAVALGMVLPLLLGYWAFRRRRLDKQR